jgi:hypothetical protein
MLPTKNIYESVQNLAKSFVSALGPMVDEVEEVLKEYQIF